MRRLPSHLGATIVTDRENDGLIVTKPEAFHEAKGSRP
jgi:hypothetical protein